MSRVEGDVIVFFMSWFGECERKMRYRSIIPQQIDPTAVLLTTAGMILLISVTPPMLIYMVCGRGGVWNRHSINGVKDSILVELLYVIARSMAWGCNFFTV